jgi:endonuclease YncB( thermonuclease family)
MMLAFLCLVASVTDGDTLRCADGTRVRLAGIDAPEMPGHCAKWRQCTPGDPFAAKQALARVAGGKALQCEKLGASYNRVLATCRIAGFEPACYMVTHGYAVRRYSESWRVCRRGDQ